jgi:CubicO group peptidase (beta-lactamase class C family)
VRDAVAGAASELRATAARFVKENRLPGAAVGVVAGQDLAWSAGIGFADVTARRAPDAETLYRVASVTKTFTGTAIMQLAQAGLLHLDDPAVAHLPELRGAASPFGPLESVTIRRMMSHESGLLSEPPGTDWATLAYEPSAQRNLGRVAEIGTKIPPNSQLKYSNLAYQLLGEIVTRVSGEPYPSYLRRAVLEPLGMCGSGFDPRGQQQDRCATGYRPRVFSDDLDVATTMTSIGAEGGLWSSVTDLARWVTFQLGAYRQEPGQPGGDGQAGHGQATDGQAGASQAGDGQAGASQAGDGQAGRPPTGPAAGADVLASELLKAMHKPRYLSDDTWTTAWAISWYAVRRDDVVWIQHSGDLPGFSANICFDRTAQVGAIALLNGTGDAAALAMDLATIARRSVLAGPPEVSAPAPTPGAYRPLLGWYAIFDQAMFVRLEWRDGKLTFVDPDNPPWRPVLAPTDDPDVFIVEPGFRQSGELARFERLADGRVARVQLAAMTMVRLEPAGQPSAPS